MEDSTRNKRFTKDFVRFLYFKFHVSTLSLISATAINMWYNVLGFWFNLGCLVIASLYTYRIFVLDTLKRKAYQNNKDFIDYLNDFFRP